ncbi:TolC family protein [Campylobacter concisus]|nr:TolC family protein [Campylobacter concisus]
MKNFLFIFLPVFLLSSNLSEIANKATQNEISKIKELELKRANLNDEATLSSYMPSLSLEGSYGKNASTFPSVVAKESAGVLARIDFLLYDGGAREARLKMSQLLKNKAAIASDEAKNYLAFKAVNLYFNACALENIIAAKNAQANFLKGVLDKLEKANIAGLAAKDELENVRAKYYLANSTQLEYKNKMEQILNEINLLTGEQI